MFRRSTVLFKRHVENWRAITQQTNVPVVRNARQILVQLYRKTLEDVKEIPLTAAYRQNVEAITKWRLSVCEATQSNKHIEMALEAGIMEDIIGQAKMELELIPAMIARKPWEVPEDWEGIKMNVDGFEFDWMELRKKRIQKSFDMRKSLKEDERKALYEQWMTNSDPNLEIYPLEMAKYKSKGCFMDLKVYKGVRFGA